jgi:hypothetical protein
MKRTPATEVLSAAVASLMVIQAAAGLLFPGLYRDEEWIRAAWFGNDLVTLFVAAPLLITALTFARRGSMRGQIVAYAALGYAVYNYGFYLFGARMNAFFPLYVILFVLPTLALILALARLDPSAIASAFRPRTPVRWIGGYMLATGAVLATAWTLQWALLVFRGIEPAIGEEALALIAAMDLAFVVPYMMIGGVLLWRRRPWGFVLGPIMILKGATYTLVLTASSTIGALRGLEGSAAQIPVWAVWTLLGLGAMGLLLRDLEDHSRQPDTRGGRA